MQTLRRLFRVVHLCNLLEYLTGSSFTDNLIVGGLKPNADGTLPMAERPGWGITVDSDALARYSGVNNFLGRTGVSSGR
ncbi:MAG TPA: hypothetical protein VEN79_00370 [Terriglobia bacterium]|nr:hypothetical protein [Terriglobia bacterium]